MKPDPFWAAPVAQRATAKSCLLLNMTGPFWQAEQAHFLVDEHRDSLQFGKHTIKRVPLSRKLFSESDLFFDFRYSVGAIVLCHLQKHLRLVGPFQ
jgi:hypothetical protein